jgi:hypothetical protein
MPGMGGVTSAAGPLAHRKWRRTSRRPRITIPRYCLLSGCSSGPEMSQQVVKSIRAPTCRYAFWLQPRWQCRQSAQRACSRSARSSRSFAQDSFCYLDRCAPGQACAGGFADQPVQVTLTWQSLLVPQSEDPIFPGHVCWIGCLDIMDVPSPTAPWCVPAGAASMARLAYPVLLTARNTC